jgi:hypothetical protein
MVECLNQFSILVAIEKNRSFHYFIANYTSGTRGAARIPSPEEILGKEEEGKKASFTAANRDRGHRGRD